MRKRLLLSSALLACLTMSAGCANSPPLTVPLLALPDVGREPCHLTILPDNPTQADLDAAYIARATDVAICDGKRRVNEEAFDAQQRAITPPARRPFWKVW